MSEPGDRPPGEEAAQGAGGTGGAARPAAERRRGDDRFRRIVEQVRDYAILMLDPQGRVETWNAGAERIKGFRAEEIVGQHFSRFYPAEERAAGKPQRALETAARAGRWEEEGWRVRKDGSTFWASVVITALRDDQGALVGFAKVTRDLTERREAQERERRLAEEESARRAAEAGARQARLAQQEERRQREQLRVTLASIGDAVVAADRHGVVTFLNASASALTGWTQAEAAGQPVDAVFRVVNEETRRPVESPVAHALREGVVVGLANHTLLLARDGREIPIDDSAAPIRGEDGEVAGVVLVFRDVTEARRSVEARLHLASIVESSEDAIISESLDGTVVSWNRAAERLYGYKADELVGRSLALLVPPDHPDEVPAILERIRRGEHIEHFETVRMRKDGSRVDVSLTLSPVRSADGSIVGASKIARDITARRRREAGLGLLAQASKLLAGELADVRSALRRVAALAVPEFADACAVDLLEEDGSLRRAAFAHAHPAAAAGAAERARLEEALEPLRRHALPSHVAGPGRVLLTGRAESLSEPEGALAGWLARDDAHRLALAGLGLRSGLAVPLATRARATGVLVFLHAWSGRRFSDEDLRLAEELGQRVSMALENARLYAELREADRQKNDWIAMLAHELRNPLAAIRTAVHVMAMPGADPRAIERARQVTDRQVEHVVRLVDDLLDVSRIVRGRIELRREPVDLAAVVARGVETVAPALAAREQRLEVDAPEGMRVEGDSARLAQVVGNLLHNASKFSPRGARVRLAVERQGSEGVIRVADEGAGIDPELLPRVFDLFTQGERTAARSEGGLGIGLTIVRMLVGLHGGSVSAASEGEGKGSAFEVRLPLVAAVAAGDSAAAGEAPAAAARRVLVVDDNADAADTIALMLRFLGHEVRVARDGPEGLAAAERFRPDVIVLDIGLPGLDGHEVARRLRRSPALRGVRLIAVTGYGQEEDRRRSAEAGFDEHLVKPVDPQVLRRAIEAR